MTRTNAHIKVWPRLQTFTCLDTPAWMCRKYRHSHCQGHLLEMSWRLTSAFIPYSRVGGGGHHAHGIPTPRTCGRLRKAWIAVTAATGIPRQPGWDCARARKTDLAPRAGTNHGAFLVPTANGDAWWQANEGAGSG